MDWPVRFPAEMSAGTISVRSYDPADAAELFESLADERVWEHMSRAIPADAAALAARGAGVVGFEQFALGHDRGAHGGESRAFRTVYFEDPAYVPMIRRAHLL